MVALGQERLLEVVQVAVVHLVVVDLNSTAAYSTKMIQQTHLKTMEMLLLY